MRVTNALVTRNLIATMLDSQSRLAEAQNRVATGKKVLKMSDDPTAGTSIMQMSGQLRGMEQYQRNVSAVSGRLDAEEVALDQVTQLLTRAKELAMGQTGATASAASRAAAGAEVRQLFGQVLTIANQKYGDDYLFGGSSAQGGAPPFDGAQTAVSPRFVALDPAASPAAVRLPVGRLAVEIGPGQTLPGQHDGDTVFVQTGVLRGLDALATALENNDPTGVGTAMGALDGSFTQVQALVGEIGARQNQVEVVRNGIEALSASLGEQKSDLSEVDMEQAITEMVSRQTAYQSAMLASSKLMGLSLTDYLR